MLIVEILGLAEMVGVCGVRGVRSKRGGGRSVLCVGVDVGVSFPFSEPKCDAPTEWIVIFGFGWVVVLLEN